MAKKCMVKWICVKPSEFLSFCTSYLHWKQQNKLFSKGQAQRTTQLLKLVDIDVCGPTQTQFKKKMNSFFT
jgi:hypothetical protein